MTDSPTESADVRLHVLDTGLIECEDFALFSPTSGPNVPKHLGVKSYLVVHPKGTLLWDTGIEDSVAQLPEGRPMGPGVVFKVPRTLRSQFDELGLDPSHIDYLAISHLHVDHLGNIELFRDATVLLQQAEFDAGYGPDAVKLRLVPETYAALDRDRIVTVDDEHDVFGDGTVIITALPGHTPGHSGLIVKLRETGPVLLAADLSYSRRDFEAVQVRPTNFDVEASRNSVLKAQRIERELGAKAWLHHDPDCRDGQRTVPAFYA